MAPRNNDADTNYQKNACSDDADIDIEKSLPCLLHKKHKVVKLVKSQLLKIRQEGLFADDNSEGSDLYVGEEIAGRMGEIPGTSRAARSIKAGSRLRDTSDSGLSTESSGRNNYLFCYLLAFFFASMVLAFLMVWISIGPLSNSIPHTPIPATSFVRHDSICALEKKYLLRWSKPDYFE